MYNEVYVYYEVLVLVYDCRVLGCSMLVLQNLESELADRVVVEVAHSAARDH